MAKTSTTSLPLQNWCDKSLQHRSATEAIFALDISAQDSADAARDLNVAWTAIAILQNAKGIIAPEWLSHVARFHRLSAKDLIRVRDAIEMRLRAFERAAA